MAWILNLMWYEVRFRSNFQIVSWWLVRWGLRYVATNLFLVLCFQTPLNCFIVLSVTQIYREEILMNNIICIPKNLYPWVFLPKPRGFFPLLEMFYDSIPWTDTLCLCHNKVPMFCCLSCYVEIPHLHFYSFKVFIFLISIQGTHQAQTF